MDNNTYDILHDICSAGNYEAYITLYNKGIKPIILHALSACNAHNLDIISHMDSLGLIEELRESHHANTPMGYAFVSRSIKMLSYLIERRFPMHLDDLIDIAINKDRTDFIPVLSFLHDHGYVYNWGCPNCIHCNKAKKEKLEEEWYMDSEIYNSIIQWLPKEIVEDTLVLL